MQKALMQMNLQLQHVVADITGVTGMRIIRGIAAGERDPRILASYRNYRCHASAETIRQALVGNYREEHVFALTQALELYDLYQAKVEACDARVEAVLERLRAAVPPPAEPLPPARDRTRQANAPSFDVRAALHALLGVDLTRIHGLGPYLALKLVGECGTDLSAWPSAKHFTSWLCLSPSNKISGARCCRRARAARAAGRRACCGWPRERSGARRRRSAPYIVGCRRGSARPRRSPRRRARSRSCSTTRFGTAWTTPIPAPPTTRSATGNAFWPASSVAPKRS